MIEAKPKGASEPTLAVAREVLAKFLDDKPRVSVYHWPPRERPEREHRERDEMIEDDYNDGTEWQFDIG